MPELSNIQTFEKIDGSAFEPTLNRFCTFLKNINLWNKEIEDAFDKFEWKADDDGFIYSSVMALGFFTSRRSSIKIRPLIMIYTSGIDDTFKDNWICCELLIEAEELRNFETGNFYQSTYNLIYTLAYEFQKEFKQTGIYFTDEAQDGADFDGIRCNDMTKIWQFDYALIPIALEKLYSELPNTHQVKRHENYLEAWYITRWQAPLTQNTTP